MRELIRLGYRCLIKSVHRIVLPESLLGTVLDQRALAQMEACGADLCGENGEYHTLVTDGPIFRRPLAFQTGGILRFGAFSVIEVTAEQSPSAT